MMMRDQRVFPVSYTDAYARGTTRWMKQVMWCAFFTFLEKSASKNCVIVISQRGAHMGVTIQRDYLPLFTF